MKKVAGRYLVSGRLGFRGHRPGATFEACLNPALEARAVHRGNITLLERITLTVHKLPHELPQGWLTP